ncbi:MAG: ATP-dependent DNA helicase RecG [Rhodospirillales bacterium]|nr:MAG: ATP-dependent DNA helicase RecG [Rhodospirillales bacterium]
MRPEILYPLFASVTSLPGVGPRIATQIEKVAGSRVLDLLWHLPRGLIDRRFSPKISDAPCGPTVTLTVRVDSHLPPRDKRVPYRILCSDETGFLYLVFFHARADYLERTLPPGAKRVVSGHLERFRDELQMPHPDHIVSPENAASIRRVEPVYPMTAGLSPKILASAMTAALARAPDLPEWLEPTFRAQRGWDDWLISLKQAHAPGEEAELLPAAKARARLAYDELLANQLALALIRHQQRERPGRALSGDGGLRQSLLEALPFSLTRSQQTALDEILSDMARPARMLRLLQGDVGSGKTVVALFAMLAAVECGGQAALMAPTELLARQHYATIKPLIEATGIEVALLAGRDRRAARREALDRLADGSAKIAIGTHALFQESVRFKDLMLAVIDEQHRFGVHQRLDLATKGKGVDMLVMTATPIPRSLMLTAYGDLASSRLTDKPAGRGAVTTRAIPLARVSEIVDAVARAASAGARVYWVCPLVAESEASDLAAAEGRFADLSNRFGGRVALIHGQMKGPDKDAAMQRFAKGDAQILVATTVIEVGIDVPEATVMVIEHAERFGLAQLHQLRGRVGRAGQSASCLLLYGEPLGATARARLEVMRETDDGFRIAEEDLRLRGAGEVLGTRQSGMPDFRLADIAAHGELLAIARDDAKLILARDPGLESGRGQSLRVLLYLFERDAAVLTLRSG